jgi:hypothetical protein
VSLTETLTLLHITRAVFSSLHKAALRIGAREARQMERLVQKTALLIETVEIKMAGAKKRLLRPHTSEDWCEAPVKQIERLRRRLGGTPYNRGLWLGGPRMERVVWNYYGNGYWMLVSGGQCSAVPRWKDVEGALWLARREIEIDQMGTAWRSVWLVGDYMYTELHATVRDAVAWHRQRRAKEAR